MPGVLPLPLGAATSALQTTINTSIQSILTQLTTIVKTGTFLKEIAANNTLTRPADTTAYASGDLIANDTTVGNVTLANNGILSITAARSNDQPVNIQGGKLTRSGTGTGGKVRAHIYNTLPVLSTNGDNGAIKVTKAGYCGSIDFDYTNTDGIFSDGSKVYGVPVNGSAIFCNPVSGTQTLYAVFESRATWTPGSSETFNLTLLLTQA